MRRMILIVGSALIVGLGLGLLIVPSLGWATPFALPHQFKLNGKTYYDGDAYVPDHFACLTRVELDKEHETPTRPTGSIFGYFTGDKPLLLPHYEWHYPFAYVLYVRNGGCFQEYRDIADGP